MQSHRPPQHSKIREHVAPEDRPKTHARNRRCRTCSAVLSIYNELDQCWACRPTGRKIHKFASRDKSADVIDFQELMEEAA